MQTNVDKDQVKAAIKAQQDQQLDNASIWTWIFNSMSTFCYLNWSWWR
jgi:hypothetical protein